MTRISTKSIVMGFVILVTAAVFGLMIASPFAAPGAGSMSDHEMEGMPMDGHDMTGH